MKYNMQLELVDGEDKLSLNDPKESIYLTASLDGLSGLPPIRTSSGNNVGADGGWVAAQLFDARPIVVNGVIANSDISIVEEKRRKLNSFLARKKMALTITTEAGSTYSVYVRVMEVEMNLGDYLESQPFMITFRADDPLIYSGDANGDSKATLLVKKPGDGFLIPFNLPLTIPGSSSDTNVKNEGNSAVDTIIKLYGPLHSPTIVNKTTNKQMQIIKDLVEGDIVEIDSKFKTITLNGVDIYNYKSPESSFITIEKGNNMMYLTSLTTGDLGKAEIYFKSGFYSI